MSISRKEAEDRIKNGEPIQEWVRDDEDGKLLIGINNFPTDNLYLTPEFEDFAERNRASWSILNYIQVILRQRRNRRKMASEDSQNKLPKTGSSG